MDATTALKVTELLGDLYKSLKLECDRLYRSGGIDINRYDINQYALAKVLISAAVQNMADVYYPKHDKAKQEDIKNLTRI